MRIVDPDEKQEDQAVSTCHFAQAGVPRVTRVTQGNVTGGHRGTLQGATGGGYRGHRGTRFWYSQSNQCVPLVYTIEL